MIHTLIFDSDLIFIDDFTKFLKKHNSIKLTGTANNGVDAIKLFSKHLPELVVLDFDLFMLDGLFIIREIIQISPSVKIILTAVSISKITLKTISKFSNVIILYKPFTSKMFLEKFDKCNL